MTSITAHELRAHFGGRGLTLLQQYRLDLLKRTHERLIDDMQAGRSEGAYLTATILAHLAHKLHGGTQ